MSTRPRQSDESFWSFACRDGGHYAMFMRGVVNQWFDEFPREEQPQLADRMRSGSNAFHAGCLELFTYQLLSRLQMRPEVIPRVSGVDTPDFHAYDGSGSRVVVEARRTSGARPKEWTYVTIAKEALAGELLASQQHDLVLVVSRSGIVNSTPDAKRLRRLLREFLASLQAQAYLQARRAGMAAVSPLLKIPLDGGTYFEVGLLVPPPDANADATIVYPFEAALYYDTVASVRSALKSKKASRYGLSTEPYVISLSVHGGTGISDSEIEEALFGSGADGRSIANRRDGFWNSKQNTRVSAVIVTTNVLPAPTHAGFLKLYQNPWAANPVASPLLNVDRVVAVGANLTDHNGLQMADIFP